MSSSKKKGGSRKGSRKGTGKGGAKKEQASQFSFGGFTETKEVKAAPAASGDEAKAIELMAIAEASWTQTDIDATKAALKTILDNLPKYTPAMDLLAEVSIAEDNKPLAYDLLKASTQISPVDSHEKWMILGQLHIELDKIDEGMKAYGYGVSILKKQYSKAVDEAKQEIGWALSSALVTVSQLYTNPELPLCEADDAQSKSLTLMEEAAGYCDINPEVYQARCGYFTILEQPEEAFTALHKCIELTASLADTEDAMEYDFKCNTARLAFDLEQWQLAAQLTDELTQEVDFNPDTWFLLAQSHFKAESYGEAVEAAERALSIATAESKKADAPAEISEFISTVEHLRNEAAQRAAAQPNEPAADGDDNEGDDMDGNGDDTMVTEADDE